MSEYRIEIKIIERANEAGVKVTNEDIEQKIDKRYPELEGKKYFDSCDISRFLVVSR